MPRPRLQPISFFSIGSSGSTAALSSFLRSGCGMVSSNRSACQRRLEAAEEQPGNQQPDPDHKSEQADEIHRGKLAKTLLPELAEVREHADRKERQDKEDDPEDVGLARRGGERLGDFRRRSDREPERDGKDEDKAEDEFRETLPDFRRLGLVRSLVDVVGPDIAENERPDPDEDIDENLHG